MTARQAALTAIERCRRGGAWSDALLDSLITSGKLDRREAALASRLCYGVLQNMALCDFYIDCYSSTKSGRLEPKVLDILRISVYQIVFMDKIPPHAAVSEAVELTKSTGFGRASGLVNAVLRRVAENRQKLPEVPCVDPAEYLSIKYSHPLWLTQELLKTYGLDFSEKYFSANNAPAPVTAQVNTLKTDTDALIAALSGEGAEARRHAFAPDCIELARTGKLSDIPEFENGEFYVQDAAAKMAVNALSPSAGMTILDACAAPGGKSFAAAIAMQGEGSVIACDINAKKLGRIESGAKRLGLSIINTKTMDARRPDAEFYEKFDAVIADAPCSGLGVIRKKPDIRYKNEKDLEALPAIQLEILEGLADCVKPGGRLLYSTCTVLKRENEAVASQFLKLHGEFSAESFELPGSIAAQNGRLTLWPHIHGTDGFFICMMRKTKRQI